MEGQRQISRLSSSIRVTFQIRGERWPPRPFLECHWRPVPRFFVKMFAEFLREILVQVPAKEKLLQQLMIHLTLGSIECQRNIRSLHHSYLNATIGSTRAARRAGMKLATNAIETNTPVATAR